MDRLTAKDEQGAYLLLSGEYANLVDAAIDRLAAYEDAEEQGLLIALPFKVGDTVYQTDGVRIYESTVRKVIYDTGHLAFDDDAIGRSVFRSHEEAEAALGGGGDG